MKALRFDDRALRTMAAAMLSIVAGCLGALPGVTWPDACSETLPSGALPLEVHTWAGNASRPPPRACVLIHPLGSPEGPRYQAAVGHDGVATFQLPLGTSWRVVAATTATEGSGFSCKVLAGVTDAEMPEHEGATMVGASAWMVHCL